jgi:hypothetical protein
MEIGKMIAAHHELAHRTACLHYTKSVLEAPLVTLNLVHETTLQGLTRVIQALLSVPYAVEQLSPQRARATIDLSL